MSSQPSIERAATDKALHHADALLAEMKIHISSFGAKETADRLATAVGDRGMTLFARINHAVGAADVGMQLRPTEVLIFGNALSGTPLMQDAQMIGIDLPMKVLFWEDNQGSVWLGFNEPSWLAERHGIDPLLESWLSALSFGLEAVAKQATAKVRNPFEV